MYYMSELEGASGRERLLGRWKDSVKECLNERGVKEGLEQARKECMDRRGGGSSTVATP